MAKIPHVLHPIVEFDMDRQLDREFVEWFESETLKPETTPIVKDLLLRGYLMTVAAISAHQHSFEARVVEDNSRRRAEELERVVASACMAEAEKSRAEHRAELEGSKAEVERSKAELERFRSELERSRAELEMSRADSRAEGKRVEQEVQEMRAIQVRLQDRIRALAAGEDERVRGIEERWRAEVDRTAARVEETTEALRREFDGRVALEVIRSTREVEDRTREAERFRLLYEQLTQRQTADVVADKDACISGLHEQLATMGAKVEALSRINDVLSRSNAGKGNLGEDALLVFFRENFTDCEVLDASRIPCACDIHLVIPDVRPRSNPQTNNQTNRTTSPNNRTIIQTNNNTATSLIAIESKNKRAITSSDITKFYRDVDNLTQQHGDAFMGAIFVSLATKNIPGKGDFRLESRAGKTLLFIATTTTANLKSDLYAAASSSSSDIIMERDIAFLLKKAVPIIVHTCRPSARDDRDKCNDMMRIEIDRATKRMCILRDDIKKLRAAATETHRVCERMHEEMGVIMEALLSSLLGSRVLDDTSDRSVTAEQYHRDVQQQQEDREAEVQQEDCEAEVLQQEVLEVPQHEVVSAKLLAKLHSVH
jgi:hypothetical protein